MTLTTGHHRATARSAPPAAITVVIVMAVLAALLPGLVGSGASAAPRYAVSVNVSSSSAAVGETVQLGGRVSPAARGQRVRVEQFISGAWRTVARPLLTRSSTYTARVRFATTGVVRLRVAKPARRAVRTGFSREVNVRVTATADQPVIATSSLPAGQVGVPYSTRVRTNDNRSGTWSDPLDELPAGLSISPSTGIISGTPAVAGTASVAIGFRDSLGGTAVRRLALRVAPASSNPPPTPNPNPVIATTDLPVGVVGEPYSARLQTADGRGGAWSVIAGSLPSGLSLSSTTGSVTGTPTTAGSSGVTVQFRDDAGRTVSRAYTISVTGSSPVIATASLPAGSVGTPYSTQLRTIDGRDGTWSVASGALPAGLSLAMSTGVISGTPTTSGSTTFTVAFRDASSSASFRSFSIAIQGQTPLIATSNLPAGVVGAAYSARLDTVDGRAGTWSVVSGSLPAGLSLNATSGAINGTPTVAGERDFRVRFVDSAGLFDTRDFTIAVVSTAPSITTTTLPAGVVGESYSVRLRTADDRPGLWSVVDGSLPSGLSLNAQTGVISGSPTTVQSSTFRVRLRDGAGAAATQDLAITIVQTRPVIATSSLPDGATGQAYSTRLDTVDSRPGTWAVQSGALPSGLSLTPSTGVISGTPTSTGTASFVVQFTDGVGLTTSRAYTITVPAPPAPTPPQTCLLPPILCF